MGYNGDRNADRYYSLGIDTDKKYCNKEVTNRKANRECIAGTDDYKLTDRRNILIQKGMGYNGDREKEADRQKEVVYQGLTEMNGGQR